MQRKSREAYRKTMADVVRARPTSDRPAAGSPAAEGVFSAQQRRAPKSSCSTQFPNTTPTTALYIHTAAATRADAEVNESTPLNQAERDGQAAAYARANVVPFTMFILHAVSSYIAGARRAGLITGDTGPAGINGVSCRWPRDREGSLVIWVGMRLTSHPAAQMQLLLNSLTTNLSNAERIVETPVPPISVIHTKQVVLVYLLALPLTLVSELSWRMIPVVGIVAFTLLGIEGISSEIESPFGDDPSDHPLDLLCARVRHELEHMMLLLDEGIKEEM